MRPEAGWLLARLDELEAWETPCGGADRLSAGTADRWRDEDVQHLVLAVARFVRESVGLEKLEKRLRDEGNVDVEALKKAYAILKAASYQFTFASGKPFDPGTRLGNLAALIEGLQNAPRLHQLEVSLRIYFAGDAPIDSLLMAATTSKALRPVSSRW